MDMSQLYICLCSIQLGSLNVSSSVTFKNFEKWWQMAFTCQPCCKARLHDHLIHLTIQKLDHKHVTWTWSNPSQMWTFAETDNMLFQWVGFLYFSCFKTNYCKIFLLPFYVNNDGFVPCTNLSYQAIWLLTIIGS